LDLDFERNRLRVVRKEDSKTLTAWEPKDHEGRVLPVPAEVMQLLANLQADADEGCPYVFVPGHRWKHIQRLQKAGLWNVRQRLINNLNRNFAVLRKLAGVEKFTFHDLRRSCITNWAKRLPVHVVRKLAGHSEIKTTQQYYLSVQEDDLELARQVQSEILKAGLTDPKLTHSGKNE
jgi:integrase